MHKWLLIGLVAVATLVPMSSVRTAEAEAEEEEEGEQRAAAISNLSFRQVTFLRCVLSDRYHKHWVTSAFEVRPKVRPEVRPKVCPEVHPEVRPEVRRPEVNPEALGPSRGPSRGLS